MSEIRATLHLPGRDVGAGFDSLPDLAAVAVGLGAAVTVLSPLRLAPEQLARLVAPPLPPTDSTAPAAAPPQPGA